MTHFNFYILNSIFKKSLFILLASSLCISCLPTTTKVSNYSNTLESAVGSLIKHDIDSKMSLNYATSLKLTKVYKVYYSEIITLPKEEKALFFL